MLFYSFSFTDEAFCSKKPLKLMQNRIFFFRIFKCVLKKKLTGSNLVFYTRVSYSPNIPFVHYHTITALVFYFLNIMVLYPTALMIRSLYEECFPFFPAVLMLLWRTNFVFRYRSVFIDRFEEVLHIEYGQVEYWKVYRLLQFLCITGSCKTHNEPGAIEISLHWFWLLQ